MSAIPVDNDVALTIDRVSKTFVGKHQSVKAIANISLNIHKGEFVSVIGPSGCGKTTLLRIIAGLETGYEGGVYALGKKIEKPGLDRGMLFQEHRLLPWLTVGENVALGIDGPKAHKEERVRHYLQKTGLQDFYRAYPNQLSGGMAQRVAIARALICQSNILLLDEPFGALDALTRMQMQDVIARLWESEKITTVLVTHDIEEAIFLSDRIVVMTCRPAEINTVITVELPRPRERSDADFILLRKEVINLFHETTGNYSI